MKKKISLFYIIYFSALAVLVIGLFISLPFFKKYLVAYEASQPVHTVEQIIDEYFKASDKNLLLAKSNYQIPKYSSMLEVISYLNDAIDNDDISYYSVSSQDTDKIAYAVTSKDLKIATINLTLDDEPDDNGFKKYDLSSIELTIGGSDAVKIKAPDGYTVFVNNVPLTDEYLTGDKEESESCKHMYDGVEGVTYVTYKVSGLFSEPKITAKDKSNNTVQGITSDDERVLFTVPVSYIEPTEQQSASILAAAEAYAAYMQNDAAFSKIGVYVDKNSNLYTNLRTSETIWVIDHNGYSIENPTVSELYYYDDNTYSCRVTFVHVLHRSGAEDYENNFDMTFYYRNVDGNFLIYDSQVN